MGDAVGLVRVGNGGFAARRGCREVVGAQRAAHGGDP